ncbi:hypothetical protein RHMOL_Rhmol02G0217400 [Rhododendron molle]|uniref:Uncharacterized protein n=1 Tax=Rhododendron molle TaxID=49168 RepID=A0ACC0PU24_RHOML|nr:hypothetical protein RHMOL_Rhmol02G0217400 [Rhododendron molle]
MNNPQPENLSLCAEIQCKAYVKMFPHHYTTLNAKSLRYMQITLMVSSRFSLSRFRVYINENFRFVLQL